MPFAAATPSSSRTSAASSSPKAPGRCSAGPRTRRPATPLTWIAEQEWSNGKVGHHGLFLHRGVDHGAGERAPSRPRRRGAHEPRRRHRPHGAVLRTGQLLQGRGSFSCPMLTWLYHEQNLVRPMFPPRVVPRGAHPRLEVLRPGAFLSRMSTGARHSGTCPCATPSSAAGGPQRHFRRHGEPRAGPPGLVQGRALPRQRGLPRPRPVG